ncbi:rhodanese-like domain-containing protein [Methanosarcina sp. Z-7115]|uniref:Rhodanese-like domain-containing protein n=1 Tax=Methanosarcina baikalica TaxID=3073890 RepID=A0ABU2CZH8_9EURY|nr:rhodanese-like domain-containing protein [Methanosarcina sp. Z-7115]MDR7665118.1 rhodanese-like domain-containing protein [Methanosarcina sp. Z-7115]
MRDREIITVCLSGLQAITTAMKGYGKVEVLKGGVPAWQEIEA